MTISFIEIQVVAFNLYNPCMLPWWRHQMETFSALPALCAGNSPVPGEFPAQRPVTRSLDVFFDLRLNKRLSKQSWGWWFETLSCPLWRHCDGIPMHQMFHYIQIKIRFSDKTTQQPLEIYRESTFFPEIIFWCLKSPAIQSGDFFSQRSKQAPHSSLVRAIHGVLGSSKSVLWTNFDFLCMYFYVTGDSIGTGS